eukprot:gene5118-8716_t
MGHTHSKKTSNFQNEFFGQDSLSILFGTTVSKSSPNSQDVPKFLSVGFSFIEDNAKNTKNLYIELGTKEQIVNLKKFVESGEEFDLVTVHNISVHSVTSLVSLYFQQLSEPLIDKKISLEMKLLNLNLELRDDEKIKSIQQICSKIANVNKQVIKLVIDHIKRLKKKIENIGIDTVLNYLFPKQYFIVESIQILYLYSNFDFIFSTPQQPKRIPRKYTKDKNEILKRLEKESIGNMPNSMLIDRDIETEGFSFKSSFHDGGTEEFQSELNLNEDESYVPEIIPPPPPCYSPRSCDDSFDFSKHQSGFLKKLMEANQQNPVVRYNSFESRSLDSINTPSSYSIQKSSLKLDNDGSFKIIKENILQISENED